MVGAFVLFGAIERSKDKALRLGWETEMAEKRLGRLEAKIAATKLILDEQQHVTQDQRWLFARIYSLPISSTGLLPRTALMSNVGIRHSSGSIDLLYMYLRGWLAHCSST